MPQRKISTETVELENLLRSILDRLDRLDGGASDGVWPSFPEKINLGDGGLVIRHTQDLDPLAPPGELGLYLITTIPGPPYPSSLIGTVS